MEKKNFISPAKINLNLQVLEKRPDGYHELDMVMTRISLHDEIFLSLNDGEISLSCDNPSVPLDDDNIAYKAARIFLDKTGLKKGATIDIKKRIPMGGGLGGGSSNAATVLMGLNEMTGSKLTKKELMDMGLKLGADVPFFIFKSPAHATGIGEKLRAIKDLPETFMILINPNIEIPTASIYNNLNLGLTKNSKNRRIKQFNHSLTRVSEYLTNDLEEVTIRFHPVIQDIKELLLTNGARGALMSGSGSTVFGLYDSIGSAERFLVKMEHEIVQKGWKSYVAHSL